MKARLLTDLRVRSALTRLRSVPLVGWLLSRLAGRAIPRGESLWITLSSGLAAGRTMYIDPRFQEVYLRGDYEPWVQDLLSAHLRAGDVYFDVGAHIGFFVLCAATLVGEKGRIVALEPDPENLSILQANVKRNELQGVTAIQAAAWSTSGMVTFGRPAGASGRSEGRVLGHELRTEVNEPNAASVSAVRLDDIPGAVPAVVKMDVEGAETEACKGAERLIAEKRTVWIVEAHGQVQITQLDELFTRYGYAVTAASPPDNVYGQYREKYIVARPRRL